MTSPDAAGIEPVAPERAASAGPASAPDVDADIEFDAGGHARFGPSLIAAMVLVVLVGLALHFGVQSLSKMTEAPGVIRVITQNGPLYFTDGEDLARLERRLPDVIRREHDEMLLRIERELAWMVDSGFENAVERVPDYVDWHYSLAGSGLRLGHLALGDSADFVATRINAVLWEDHADDWVAAEVVPRVRQLLQAEHSKLATRVDAAIFREFGAAHGAAGEAVDSEAEIVATFDLLAVLDGLLMATPEDLRRWSVSAPLLGVGAVATGVATTLVLARAPAAGRALAGGLRILGRRGGTAAATGALGTWAGPGGWIAVSGGVLALGLGAELALLARQRNDSAATLRIDLETALLGAREFLTCRLLDDIRQPMIEHREQRLARWAEAGGNVDGHAGPGARFSILGAS